MGPIKPDIIAAYFIVLFKKTKARKIVTLLSTADPGFVIIAPLVWLITVEAVEALDGIISAEDLASLLGWNLVTNPANFKLLC